MPASSPIGSTAPVSVVPAVATMATGAMPAATSASMAAAASAAIIRRRSSIGIDRTLPAPMPEHLGRPLHAVVGLGRAVEGGGATGEAGLADARERELARGDQRRQVRDHAAARECAARGRVAHERPTQSSAWRSTRSATPAWVARLTS